MYVIKAIINNQTMYYAGESGTIISWYTTKSRALQYTWFQAFIQSYKLTQRTLNQTIDIEKV